ncbi:MAG: hypothetical protein ACFFDN_33435 [Candidatus Hodarchaeota archaeon]
MELAEYQEYLKELRATFDLEPIHKLNTDDFENLGEYDRKIEIAKLFIPEIEKAGPYDIPYDLATTMVYMLLPIKEGSLVLERLCEHYNILKFYPWNLDCLKDWLYSKAYYYHPSLAIIIFANPGRPPPRIKNFSAFLKAIGMFKNIQLSYEQFEAIFFYYAWNTLDFQLSTTQIDILNAVLPYYNRNVEEINIYLASLYDKEDKLGDSPKYIRELVEKLGRDYKTIKRQLDQLKSTGSLHQALWLDSNYYDMESLLFLLPVGYKIRIKPSYFYRKYDMKSADKNISLLAPLIPMDYGEKMKKYIERSLKIPVKAYKIFTIPIPPYSFKFFNKSKNKTVLDWDVVDKHLKNCTLQENEKEYMPVRAEKTELDILKLKIIDIISANANVTNSSLKQIFKAPTQQLKDRRQDIEDHGYRFPYIFSPNWPELYFFKANISTIGEVNYCVNLLSLFPSVSYHWCQDIQDLKNHFLLCFIHLPIESHVIFKVFGKNKFPFEYELYYGSTMSYILALRLWELFDEEKKEFNYDFNNFKIYI